MKNRLSLALLLAFAVVWIFVPGHAQRFGRRPAPETLLPPDIVDEIINEVSGDVALQNEIFLTAVTRNRPAEEYQKGYFETAFILEKLREYGIMDSRIVELPARSFFGPGAATTWDAEMAELWLVKPEKRKIADLKEITASLCQGSTSTDTTAELVYVGPGHTETFYKDKDVKGKIVLVNGPPDMARRMAVEKKEALGLIGFSSSHPEFDRDQVGYSSLRIGEKEKPTFGFMVSQRLGQELRDMLERGMKVEVRAVCKTQQVRFKEEMVEALLKGKDFPQEELVFTAHLFEGYVKQGANDDASGCVAILEAARAIKKLQDEGKIPPLRRSIRFLFVPEISGTAAYIQKFPEIAGRFFANINEDMVGEALIKNNAYFVMIQTPHSLPTYLNDVVASFVEWMGETQKDSFAQGGIAKPIYSPTGSRDPFYCYLAPYESGSDHIVFVDGGVKVPAVFFNIWPDMWYHTSGDLPDKSDTTQLKRAAFLSVAAAVFLANAGPAEAEKMLAEVSQRAGARLAREKGRAEKMILAAKKDKLVGDYREAVNVLNQAFLREAEALSSIAFFIRGDAGLAAHLKTRLANLAAIKAASLKEAEDIYAFRCQKDKVKPQKITLTKDELRLAGLVPVRTAQMKGYFNSWEFREKTRGMKDATPVGMMFAEFEVRNFIDGRRSILDIRNGVSAEYGPVNLEAVEKYIRLLEKTGYVEIKQK